MKMQNERLQTLEDIHRSSIDQICRVETDDGLQSLPVDDIEALQAFGRSLDDGHLKRSTVVSFKCFLVIHLLGYTVF